MVKTLFNFSKKVFENRGDLSKVDMWDVGFSTLNPFNKIKGIGFGGSSILTEATNSLIDIKGKDGIKVAFMELDGGRWKKSTKDFVIDFSIGQFKSMGKNTFTELGKSNVARDAFWDIGVGLYKAIAKDILFADKKPVENAQQ